MQIARTYKNLNEVDTLFNGAFPRHAAAIEEYRFFVRREDESAYQQAWENYFYEKEGGPFFLEYWSEEGEDARELFKQRVQAIWQFTKR